MSAQGSTSHAFQLGAGLAFFFKVCSKNEEISQAKPCLEAQGRTSVQLGPLIPKQHPTRDSLARRVHLGRVKEVDTTLIGDGHQLLSHLWDRHGDE